MTHYLTRWGWRALSRLGVTSRTYDLDAVRDGWLHLGYALCFRQPCTFDVRRPGGEQ
jgi:hypothetical protein